jgi:predicted DNA repair protein MutK
LAGTSLLTLIDDIASLLDDIAMMSKVAAKKTAGVLGDDLALNAEQVSGVRAERELPVVWAVAKGSFKNKLILVPAALLLSAFIPWVITPLLMLGGAFLCFEGFEKVVHSFFYSKEEKGKRRGEKIKALADPKVDVVGLERKKIKGAIRTDFILSTEIIVIVLGTVQDASMAVQVAVVSGMALLITVGVYSLVAGIVKIDDAGLYLIKVPEVDAWGRLRRKIGAGLLTLAPLLMKTLSVVGTAAMFLVGGGILMHGFSGAHELTHYLAGPVQNIPLIGDATSALMPTLINAIVGVLAGGLLVFTTSMGKGLLAKLKGAL